MARSKPPQPGIRAIWDGICPRCHQPIVRAESRVYARRGQWYHIECRERRRERMNVLCFIDTETTGLDPRIHQPYEVCWWREDEAAPTTMRLPHTLEYADAYGLKVGGYFERSFFRDRGGRWAEGGGDQIGFLSAVLQGVTLVGSNPAFDAAMLTRVIGTAVWHHRLINVAEGGMWVFSWDRPKGLADVAAECRSRGYEIPEPDHTAEGDVRATRAVYEALRAIRVAS